MKWFLSISSVLGENEKKKEQDKSQILVQK
jgi:hypothetical protein